MKAYVQLDLIYNDENYSILLSTVDDTAITDSMTISEHPLITGDMIIDHAYKQPSKIRLSGKVGATGETGVRINGSSPSLVDFQVIMKGIMENSIPCKMTKVISQASSSNIRFESRDNLILTNINWTEGISSVDYSFSFTQILAVEEIKYDMISKDLDANLPPITEPVKGSFSQLILKSEDVISVLVKVLIDNDLMSKTFVEGIKSINDVEKGLSIAAGASVAAGIALVGASLMGGSSLAGPAGAVGIAVGAVLFLGAIIYTAVDEYKKSKKYKFLKFEDPKKDMNRFVKLCEQIINETENFNKSVSVYSVNTNEDQECLFAIDNKYYSFLFETNNNDLSRRLTIRDLSDKDIACFSPIISAARDYSQCSDKNVLIDDLVSNKTYVNLVYLGNEKEENDLTKYYVVISTFNPKDFSQMMYNTILKYITA